MFSFNENESEQGIQQLQQGRITGKGSNGLGQRQEATNTNETSQDSSAAATTKQANVNVPIAILSPGANSGDVDQSNRSDTKVASGNSNSSDQWVDQGQKGSVDDGGHKPRCEKDCGHDNNGCGHEKRCGHDQCSDKKWNKDDCKPHRPNHDKNEDCRCPQDDWRHLSQSQSAANNNETTQASSAEATTKQANVNTPISILDFGSHKSDKDKGDAGHGKGDDKGWGHSDKGWGHDKDQGHGNGHPNQGHDGDVNQSNSSGTYVVSHNANDSAQGIQQIQQGSVGGLGGNHSGQPCC